MRANRFVSAAMVLGTFGTLLTGCGGSPAPPAPAPAQPAPATPEAPPSRTAFQGTAQVAGRVLFTGSVPELKTIDMAADPGCKAKHPQAPTPEILVLGDGNALANVLVYVKSVPSGNWPVPSEAAVIDQKGCRYLPHVLGLRTGQTLKFLNSDGLLHNVHALPKVNKAFNLAMPASRTEAETKFERPEAPFTVKCDVHPWMNAYVGVFEHPYYAVTGTDGSFSIDGLPAGTYEVEAWHERLGTKTASVSVTEGQTARADYEFSR